MKLFASLILASALCFGGGAALAESAPNGGPTISGGVEIDVQAADDIAAAVGNKATAAQELGNINAGDIQGDAQIGVMADDDISAAVGNESCASQKIGSIGGAGSDC